MPELPEVEVSRLGITPHLENQVIKEIIVRKRQLRWPIPETIHQAEGLVITSIRRRAKYLLLDTCKGSIILHLGMSGKLCVVDCNTEVKKHDHLDIVMQNGVCLRFNDARRFGSCLWQGRNEPILSLLAALGPEPLTDDFDGNRLY
jgi:formamidopyrimidine-DNA glycosylase